MSNYNRKRVEFSGKNKNDAFELQKILLRNGYDCFVWACEDSIVVEYEYHDAEWRDGEYIYINPDKEYIGILKENDSNEE